MNHLKWMAHGATIMDLQRSLYRDNSLCDVLIGSDKGPVLRAHRFLLCFCSDYFKEMFRDIPFNQEVTIIVPDVRSSILKNILNFIYTGEVCVGSCDLSDFIEHVNLLGIKSAISFECHVNKQKSQQITKQLAVEPVAEVEEVVQQSSVTSKHDEESDDREKQFEYLEAYTTDEKIAQYTIEQTNNDYILTENTETTFVLPEDKTDNEIDSKRTIRQYSDEMQTDADEQEIDQSAVQQKYDKTLAESSEVVVMPVISSRGAAFSAAADEVLNFGVSLQKAATKFNVSKTVLWRRVRKNSAYKIEREHPMLSAAIEMLEKGESLKSISQRIKIPISTLHRHKVRLLQEGRLPEHVQVKRRDSKDNLKGRLTEAICACARGMSQNQAASVYSVPKSTLWRHLQKQTIKIETEIADEVSISC